MFKTIGIIGGSGQMGRMFQTCFKNLGIEVLISDEKSISFEKELVERSELVIVSVPIEHNESVVRRIAHTLGKHQLLSDFCSVKSKIIPEMMDSDASIISCHPMFGPLPEVRKQNIVLLPVRPGKHLAKYQRLYQELELNVAIISDWKKHDESMSYIQGLMHFFHIVFTQTMRSKNVDLDTLLSICSPVYRANFAFTCRILQRDPQLYTHILMDNPENIPVLNHFVKQANESIKLLQKKDEQSFIKQFLANREYLGEHGEEFNNQSDYLVEKLKQYDD